MSDDNSLESRVCQLVADQLRQPLDKVTADAHLIDDLDADSLDIVDLTIAVEEEFSTDEIQLEIPEEDAAEIRTVQNLVDYLTNAGLT
ncbi:MAG: acyl carrier protein [Chloroflexi bacterium]|nr:acyl carrier protein [Chloroflexota bacterium]MCY3588111.1 acyl carrier protein [Chloroflexota bacterium]MCY3685314.1 acyl carrier protein [Chloroflexota bacterium]MDE2707532.1 acyl carrier protein [Chloroflexota bacterium]MXV81307.1 acyl carrier protein [Chloroflexota bacterium]